MSSRIEDILQFIIDNTSYDEEVANPSRIEKILLSIKNNTAYTDEAGSRIEALLLAIKNSSSYDEEVENPSRIESILLAKINGLSYTEIAQSNIEDLLIKWLFEVIQELTGILPLTFRGNGQPLLDYLISGNMSQSGTPTPTTPIQSQETGEKTGNLFDYKTAYEQYLSGDDIVITPTQMTSERQYFKASEVGKTITISVFAKTVTSNRVFIRASIGGTNVNSNTVSRGNSGTLTVTVTPTSTSDFFNLTYGDGGDYNIFNKFMVNEGSTALPYEPYGYKLNISSGGENLIDVYANDTSNGYINNALLRASGDIYTPSYGFISEYQPINESVTYTLNTGGKTGESQSICFYTSDKQLISGVAYASRTTITFTTPQGARYFRCTVMRTQADTESYKHTMLNLGATALPYEPYNRTTTPIYLGEVQTTRRVKKAVFDGNENWTYEDVYSRFWLYVADFTTLGLRLTPFVSNSFGSVSDGRPITDVPDNTIYSGAIGGIDGHKFYIKCTTYTSLNDWKSFLAAQYQNGTPVCVWYVLATPETAVVNEPLRKIGNYADTLSMEQAGVQIPTISGQNTLSIGTTMQPSEMYIKYKEV